MRGPAIASVCGAALLLAWAAAPALAQHRPAAWDTRVKTVGTPQDAKTPDEPKHKTKSGVAAPAKKPVGSIPP